MSGRGAVVALAGRQSDGAIGKSIRHVVDSYSPIAMAAALTDHLYGDRLARYTSDHWVFDPIVGHHVMVESEELQAQARAFLDQTGVREIGEGGGSRIVPLTVRSTLVNEVVAALNDARRARVPGTASLPYALPGYTGPEPSGVIVVRNGIVTLTDGTLHPATARLFSTAGSAATFDASSACPEWDAFLVSVFTDDDNSIDYESIQLLRQWFGYALTSDTSRQKMLLLVGPRRSGKSTIARVLRALLGEGNVASPTLASLQGDFGLAPLVGKMLAIIGDARVGRDPQTIVGNLLSISGEDSLTINRKFRDAVEVRLRVRIAIITNELPYLADSSGALASRFSVVETRRSFLGFEDLDLERRLLGELPGILNWSIEGWRDLQRLGRFITPDRAREAQEDLEALGSPIRAFVADRLDVAPGREAELDGLYTNWIDWCEANGRREPGSKQVFGRNLRSAIPGLRDEKRRTPMGGRQRWYLGITIAGRS